MLAIAGDTSILGRSEQLLVGKWVEPPKASLDFSIAYPYASRSLEPPLRENGSESEMMRHEGGAQSSLLIRRLAALTD